MKNILMAAALVMLTGPAMGVNKEPIQLEIDQAVQAGFEKHRHLNYLAIGATDGWEGKWYDEKIELYQYASADNINLDIFEAEALDLHGTDWFEACQYRNLLMLSNGNKACKALTYLQSP
ncbi:hypothetical protein [Photobacterium kishitanii]|uniref:hypothetical protein n=1 Tax=Photobacterium kishitanii TaxID=318456 RepID=UPI0011B1F00A|nr:hypothetical protein [Photobacterium kishitanii]